MKSAAAFFFPLLVLVALGGCSRMAEVTSSAPTGPIAIDASTDDWQDGLLRLDDKVSMGVRNDENYLYLALVLTNEDLIRQVTMRGLTVWFDPEGGKEKHLGIDFPIGLLADPNRGRGERPDLDSRSPSRDGEAPRALPELNLDYAALRYDAEGPGERHLVGRLTGVQVAATVEARTLFYELRVPMQATEDFGLDVPPGTAIGLGLETPELERPARQQGRGSTSGGDVGRTGGGPPSDLGGRDASWGGGLGGWPSPPGSLSTWIRVTLAED